LAIFREFVKVAPAIGAPSGLDARMPEGVGVASLSAEEKLIAANCGVSEDEMKKSKQELALATRNQVSRSRRAVETDDQD
jgi:phage I-like protein